MPKLFGGFEGWIELEVVDRPPSLSHTEDLTLVKAVLCSGLYPNVVTVKNAKRRAKLMTEEDGKVECHPSSVNASVSQFTTNFLVYSEKVKTSSIFIRNSTM
eukprot:gene13348-15773_t